MESYIPSIDFPKEWHIGNSVNHWCNEETMKSYIQLVFVLYICSGETKATQVVRFTVSIGDP